LPGLARYANSSISKREARLCLAAKCGSSATEFEEFLGKAREMHRKALEQKKLYTEENRQKELAAMSSDSTTEHLAILKAERDAILAPRAGTKPNELLPHVAGLVGTQGR
jgi:hypothetical protein